MPKIDQTQLAELREDLHRSGGFRIKEPNLYEGDGHSVYLDSIRVSQTERGGAVHPDYRFAKDRLQKFAVAARDDAVLRSGSAFRSIDKRGVMAVGVDGNPQRRDLSTSPLGSGGEFVPQSLYLVNDFVGALYANAPLADASDNGPLPPHTESIVIPVINTETGNAINQPVENVGPNPAASMGTGSIVGEVDTLEAVWNVSQQLVDRAGGAGFDSVINSEFAAAAAAQLEQYLWNGTGTAGEILGVANAANIGSVACTSSTPAGVVSKIAQAAGVVGTNRLRYPAAVLASPNRCAFLLGEPDGSLSTAQRVGTGMVGPDKLGPVAGMTLYPDATLTDSQIWVARPSDLMVFLADPQITVMPQTFGQQLGVVLQLHAYYTAIIRYGQAFCEVICTQPPVFS